MKNRNFVKPIFKKLLFAYFIVYLFGCNQSVKPVEIKKTSFNADSLEEKIDSIDAYIAIGDTIKRDSILLLFKNLELARQHPELVYKAYKSALSGAHDVEMFKHKGEGYNVSRFYKEFNELAIASKSNRMQIYSDYIIARTFHVRGENEKALPKLMALVPRFRAVQDAYGEGLTYYRIGSIYFSSYKQYDEAVKYVKQAFWITKDDHEKIGACRMIISCYFNLHNCDSVKYYTETLEKLKFAHQGYNWNFANAHKQICAYVYGNNGCIDSVNKYMLPLIKLHYYDVPIPTYYKEFLSYFSPYCNALLEKKQYHLLDSLITLTVNFEKNNPDFKDLSGEFYNVCYRYYENKHNTESAFYFLKKYNNANAIISFEEEKSKVELARIEFETAQEKKSLVIAKQQSEANAEQQLQKQKILRNSFIAGSILLLLLIVLLINRNKLKRTMEMERMRSRLSRDLHDDIGSTLSSINILSRMAHSNLTQSQDEKTKASLEKINERSQRLLDNMSDIIWNINPGNDTIEEVMSRMREYATAILEAKNIDYTFNFPKEELDCTLTMEVKNNMYLIFKEAVNNLSKYSGATHATLSLTFDEKNIHLKVEDNGKGFDENEIKHRGGLSNMQHRAEEIKGRIKICSAIDKGTQIELTMPRYC